MVLEKDDHEEESGTSSSCPQLRMVDLQKAYPSASILVSDAEGWYDDGVLGPDEFRGRVHTMPVRLESSNCGAKENNLDSQSPMRLRAGSRLKLGDVLKRIRRSGSTGACNSSREAPSPKKDDDDDTLVSEPWIRVDGDFSGTDCIPTSYQSLDWDSDLVECTRSQTSSALTDFVGDDGCDELEPEEEEEERHKQAPVEISKYFSISVHSRKSTRRKSRSPNRSPTRHSASVMIRKDKQQQKESGRRAFSIHVVRRPQQSMQSPERSGPFGAEVVSSLCLFMLMTGHLGILPWGPQKEMKSSNSCTTTMGDRDQQCSQVGEEVDNSGP